MNGPVLLLLSAAKELITLPERWTDTYARDADGKEVFQLDRWAVRWCLLGAILRVSDRIGATDEVRRHAMGYMLHEAFVLGFPGWKGLNDLGHDEVMKAFDRAIARCMAGGNPVPLDAGMGREKWLALDAASSV